MQIKLSLGSLGGCGLPMGTGGEGAGLGSSQGARCVAQAGEGLCGAAGPSLQGDLARAAGVLEVGIHAGSGCPAVDSPRTRASSPLAAAMCARTCWTKALPSKTLL